MENQLTSAQLRALRLQLQPHFLFNTLNAISSLMEFDTKTAQTMVRRLGDLLRSVLDRNKRPAIPLSEELEFSKNYLAIEQIRFQDRLNVVFEVDDELYDAKVPNLLLQPLIENAIKHGFSSRTDQGNIEVIARKKGPHNMELIVRDDGNGSTLEKEVIVQKGIGLKNVCERVKHIYKDLASVIINTSEGGGFEICISLPINK